jgi:hypothetical protein
MQQQQEEEQQKLQPQVQQPTAKQRQPLPLPGSPVMCPWQTSPRWVCASTPCVDGLAAEQEVDGARAACWFCNHT